MVASIPQGELVSGHKKDVVITNRLLQRQGKIAIYGWHQYAGAPIQPLSTVHGSCYADYSHGIRLVSNTVLVAGEPQSIFEVIEDPKLAMVFSAEGAIHDVRETLEFLSSGSQDRLASLPRPYPPPHRFAARMH